MTELIVLLFSSPYVQTGIFGAIMAIIGMPFDPGDSNGRSGTCGEVLWYAATGAVVTIAAAYIMATFFKVSENGSVVILLGFVGVVSPAILRVVAIKVNHSLKKFTKGHKTNKENNPNGD